MRSDVYSVTKVLDTRHNPEFTLMELYQAYTDYHGMMDLTENLYRYVAQEVTGALQSFTYGEHVRWILSKPFERITMVDAVKKYANVDFNEITDIGRSTEQLLREHHIEFEERHKKGDILNLILRRICRGASDPANLCYGSSDRDFSIDQEKTGQSGLCRAF